MALIIIGIIFLIVSVVLQFNNQTTSIAKYARWFSIGLIAVGAFFSMFIVIDPGTVGVKTLFGSVDAKPLTNGLNVKNPFADVILYNVQTQNYTMSGVHNEGEKEGDDAIRVLSADGLEVVIDLTVLFKVMPSEAPRIYKELGVDYINTIVRPVSRTKIRDNAVYYDAVALYSTKRDEFQDRIFKSIAADFKKRGLILEQLLVRNINLPNSVKQTIESKINAEQEAQKMQFVLQKEKQEAERNRAEAQGIADYQKIISAVS